MWAVIRGCYRERAVGTDLSTVGLLVPRERYYVRQKAVVGRMGKGRRKWWGGRRGRRGKRVSRRVALWAVDCKTINVLSGPLVVPSLAFPCLPLP